MFVRSESDDPGRFKPGSAFVTGDGSTLVVAASRRNNEGAVIRFEGVNDRNAAEDLRGADLFVATASRRALGNDEFWPDELIGLEVHSGTGEFVGLVIDYLEGSGQDRLLIRSGDVEFDIPFVKALVPHVDVKGGSIVIHDIPGLRD